MYRRSLLIILLSLLFGGAAVAQEQKAIHDSLKTRRDSVRIVHDSLRTNTDSLQNLQDSSNYEAFEKYSRKTKFTRLLHNLLFKHINRKTDREAINNKKRKPETYIRTEGKIIKDILITTLDPFGYEILDTTRRPKGVLMNAGNSMHFKTRPKIIKNLLLFKEDEPYDSLLVRESERLIRSQKYVRNVSFTTLPSSGKEDSVNVYIRVLDVWSIVPAISLTGSTMRLGLTDINLAGLGNSFVGDSHWNRSTGENITRISYLIPNIRNSFISFNLQYLFTNNNDLTKNAEFARTFYSPVSSSLQYLFSVNRNLVKSIEISRSFYSPVTKWAGGIFLGQMITTQSFIRDDTIRYLSSLTNIQDIWAARSWQLFKWRSSDGLITNLILSARFLNLRNPGRTPEAIAVNIFNTDNIYFAGIGISSRKYLQDKFIFNYGKIEDVPVGRSLDMIVGMDGQKTKRLYLGLNAAWGNYYHFGYLSAHLEYGTFKTSAGFNQGVITGRINCFTRLLSLGSWKIRQFISPTLIYGINRLPGDNLTFGENMEGFDRLDYSATRMMVFKLQTQSYTPWNIIGFHFGPYLFSSFGMLGNESTGFRSSKLYSMFGLGVLIKNDYLMFSTFQISMTFYPLIPGRGYNVFRTNAYKAGDYGFRDFEISKPGVADYR